MASKIIKNSIAKSKTVKRRPVKNQVDNLNEIIDKLERSICFIEDYIS